MSAAQAVRLASDHFAENLAFAFVGGSYARGTHQATSDIDVFALLHRSDHVAERAFAENLRSLHHDAGLHFDHCGEIFDVVTLDTLLVFTEQALAAAPALQRSACYQADCPLSVFRKGDVVFKFLADPKIYIDDPQHLIPALEERALAYFTHWPMPRVQEYKNRLALPTESEQSRLIGLWGGREAGQDWTDTPVGIGLDRWFGSTLQERARRLPPHSVTATPGGSLRCCPLPFAAGPARAAFAAQCLAFPHTHPEGL